MVEQEPLNEYNDISYDFKSRIYRVNNATRVARITTILPLTEVNDQGNRVPLPFWIYHDAAAWLAAKHFNERNPRIVKDLHQLTQGCDLQINLTMRDSVFTPHNAVVQLLEALQVPDLEQPAGLIGCVRSAVSIPLAVFSSTYELPQLSSSSTSRALDSGELYPFFGRTIPTNAADAKVLCIFFQSLGVTHFGVIYIQDEYGVYFVSDIENEAKARNMVVLATPIQNNADRIRAAVDILTRSEYRYFFGIFDSPTWQPVMRRAYDVGIMGTPGYTWMLSESAIEFTNEKLRLDPIKDADLVTAIHGVGYVILEVPENKKFYKALSELPESPSMQEELISVHPEKFAFENFNLNQSTAITSQYHLFNYDAVMSMAIAICRADHELPTGPQIFASFLKVRFRGASGDVQFDLVTGSRLVDSLKYAIVNVVQKKNLIDGMTGFDSTLSSLVSFAQEEPLQHVTPFIFTDGSIYPPQPLPTPALDLNLIPPRVRGFGFALFVLVSLTSIWWALFTFKYRNTPIVKASQPFFLSMICIGTFTMGLSILMSGFQEPMPLSVLNFACEANIWFFSTGFITAFCAIFCKMWRLNRLHHKAELFQRVVIKPKDVLYPFGIMMSVNIAILTCWTVLDPRRWTRVDLANYHDTFGRSSASVGLCLSSPSGEEKGYFIYLYFGVTIAALLIANYQSFVARNYPSPYNEGFHIAMSVGFLLEACLVGSPVLYLVRENPRSNFLVTSILITMVCLVILLPIFVPKYLARNEKSMVEPYRAVSNHSPLLDAYQFPSMRHSRSLSLVSGSTPGSRRPSSDAIPEFHDDGYPCMIHGVMIASMHDILEESSACVSSAHGPVS